MWKVLWTKTILEEFIREGMLTKEEEMIMRTRVAGWTRTQQAMNLGMSVGTVDNIIKRLKEKYEYVQKTNVLLPPMKPSAQEDYQDTH